MALSFQTLAGGGVGLANGKGSPHAVELINPLFHVAKVSLRGTWLLAVVIMKDVWQDLLAAAQFLTCQTVSADIQWSFARSTDQI